MAQYILEPFPTTRTLTRRVRIAWEAPFLRLFIFWITDAKWDATRQKRIREAVRMLRENKKLGMT